MTILCLALGNPAPTISLYVGGHLVRQDTSRHMVTVIHNVTADMEHISCYADNGYGVPMQATRRVNICCEYRQTYDRVCWVPTTANTNLSILRTFLLLQMHQKLPPPASQSPRWAMKSSCVAQSMRNRHQRPSSGVITMAACRSYREATSISQPKWMSRIQISTQCRYASIKCWRRMWAIISVMRRMRSALPHRRFQCVYALHPRWDVMSRSVVVKWMYRWPAVPLAVIMSTSKRSPIDPSVLWTLISWWNAQRMVRIIAAVARMRMCRGNVWIGVVVMWCVRRRSAACNIRVQLWAALKWIEINCRGHRRILQSASFRTMKSWLGEWFDGS